MDSVGEEMFLESAEWSGGEGNTGRAGTLSDCASLLLRIGVEEPACSDMMNDPPSPMSAVALSTQALAHIREESTLKPGYARLYSTGPGLCHVSQGDSPYPPPTHPPSSVPSGLVPDRFNIVQNDHIPYSLNSSRFKA